MQIETNCLNAEHDATQFGAIRDLMLEASTRGDWLTLAEIAVSTEFGEASISAQLRHLRKPRFGCYRVEKRRRDLCANSMLRFSGAHYSDMGAEIETVRQVCASGDNELQRIVGPWEYRVFTAHAIKRLETLKANDAISELVDELARSHNVGRSQNLGMSHNGAASQSGMPPVDESMHRDGVSESRSAATGDFAACIADAASPLAGADAANANAANTNLYSLTPMDTGEGDARASVRTVASDASAQEVCDR